MWAKVKRIFSKTTVTFTVKPRNLPSEAKYWHVTWFYDGQWNSGYADAGSSITVKDVPNEASLYCIAYNKDRNRLTSNENWGHYKVEDGGEYVADFSTMTLTKLETCEDKLAACREELEKAKKTIDVTQLTSAEIRDLIIKSYSQVRENLGIKPQEVSASDVEKAFKERYGDVHQVCWDRKFYACTAEEYTKIAKFLWQDRKEWVKAHYDCDNFAGAWKVFCYEVFGITAVSLSIGTVYDKGTDKVVGGHAYNHNFTTDKGVKLFEAESDGTTDGDVIGQWRYKTSQAYWW